LLFHDVSPSCSVSAIDHQFKPRNPIFDISTR
jgi:hypothetical protein